MKIRVMKTFCMILFVLIYGHFSITSYGEVTERVDMRINPVIVDLVPDFNRDGKINGDDRNKVSKENPFRFWINDDDDVGEVHNDDIPEQGDNADNMNSKVDGLRDLVDFFPLFFDAEKFLSTFDDLSVIDMKLSGAPLQFIRYPVGVREILPEDAGLYLKDLSFAQKLANASTMKVSSNSKNPTSLGAEFVTLASEGKGILFFEGVDISENNPLVLHVFANDTEIFKRELPLKLSSVEQMFEHRNITNVTSKYEGDPITPSIPAAPSRYSAPNWPDELVNNETFIFIHGYNVDGQKARGWNCEVFKRMHQMGSYARFVGLTWHGATNLDYHKAVFQAFQTGEVLKNVLSSYNQNVTIAAHSLGNMVVSHAIQSGNFRPDRYYMINAAVPIEAYTFSGVEVDMVEDDWQDEYNDGLERLFSATWHQLFEGTSDNRQFLKWRNQFEAVAEDTELHNFFSPGEDVLDKMVGVYSASVIGTLFRQGFDLGRGAWKTQELVKGVSWAESLAAIFMSRGQAGWDDGFFLSKYPFTRKENITNEQLMRKPYFDNFKEDDLTDEDPAIASAKAAEEKVQYDLLARGIPALSYAAAVDVVSVGTGLILNFDMETDGRSRGEWPTEGHEGEALGDWLHSDFRNVALPYVHKMYKAMIDKGNLNEN